MPYKYVWISDAAGEIATFTFYVMTGFYFRPHAENPYFALQDDEISLQVRRALVHRPPFVHVMFGLVDMGCLIVLHDYLHPQCQIANPYVLNLGSRPYLKTFCIDPRSYVVLLLCRTCKS